VDCPVCGCAVEVEDPDRVLFECACCLTVWLVLERTQQLDRVLVGSEG